MGGELKDFRNLGKALDVKGAEKEAAVANRAYQEAKELLDQVAALVAEGFVEEPLPGWWKRYYRLDGRHMVLTEIGWLSPDDLPPELTVLEEINAPEV